MELLNAVRTAVFGTPTVIFIIAVGIYLSASNGFFQLFRFPLVIKSTFLSKEKDKESGGTISAPASFFSSLAATIGTGSITGVAAAITLGGAGAVFWMWVAGIVGMMLSYAEGVLSVRFRKKEKGGYDGSAMHYIEKAFKSKRAGVLYAVLLVGASLGMGNIAQGSAMALACEDTFGISKTACGIIAGSLVLIVSMGGIKSLASLSLRLVPIMSALYIGGCLVCLWVSRANLLPALSSIVSGAVSPRAVSGGLLGCMMTGFRRGIFSTEAGLGTTGCVHAKSAVQSPARQGMWCMLEVFTDTFVIGTLTALAVLSTGADTVWQSFSESMGKGGETVCSLATILFAFASICGFSAIGKSAFCYISKGRHSGTVFSLLFCYAVYFGCVIRLDTALLVSDILNGLMALPNLTALIILAPVIKEETRRFIVHRERDG